MPAEFTKQEDGSYLLELELSEEEKYTITKAAKIWRKTNYYSYEEYKQFIPIGIHPNSTEATVAMFMGYSILKGVTMLELKNRYEIEHMFDDIVYDDMSALTSKVKLVHKEKWYNKTVSGISIKEWALLAAGISFAFFIGWY